MKPVTPVVLEGRVVRLVPLQPEHLPLLYAHADPAIYAHLLDWPEDDSREAFVAWMQRSAPTAPDRLPFAITLKATGEPIGTTSFLEVRPAHRRLEIGATWVARAHQGTQVNPEAKLLLLRHAFETLGAFRVELKTSSENHHSQAAISKLGAVREGVLRNYQVRRNGRPRDSVMFSITDREWPTVKLGLQRRLGRSARDVLVETLAPHVATDEKERADLAELQARATALGEPFSRAQPEAHFTGSAVVTDVEGQRVCLIHHGKLHRWLQPGGHADEADGGSMELTALREAREETGLDVALHPTAPRPLDVDIHVIPARKTEAEHRHLDVRYLVVARNPEALAHDPSESHGAQWLSWEDALARADEPALTRLLLKARAAAAR